MFDYPQVSAPKFLTIGPLIMPLGLQGKLPASKCRIVCVYAVKFDRSRVFVKGYGFVEDNKIHIHLQEISQKVFFNFTFCEVNVDTFQRYYMY